MPKTPVRINETYNGQVYTSIPKLAKATGIKKDTLYRRRRRGIRGQDLVAKERVCSRIFWEKDGKRYTTKEVAEKFNISLRTAQRWLSEGKDPEKSVLRRKKSLK